MLCALLANINRSQNVPAFEVADFLVGGARKPAPPPQLNQPKKMTEAQRIKAALSGGG